jgi:hypothetical protein
LKLLDSVFSYVGVGDYFFAAGVCRRWRGSYIKLCYNEAAADQADKLRTTYSSAFMTAARLQLAFRNGLEAEMLHHHEGLADVIVKNSLEPIEALTVAKTYDMRYPDDIAIDAAYTAGCCCCSGCTSAVVHSQMTMSSIGLQGVVQLTCSSGCRARLRHGQTRRRPI